VNRIQSFVALSIAWTFSAGCVSNAPTVATAPYIANRAPAAFGGHSYRRDRRPNTVLVKLRPDATREQMAALQALYHDLDLRHEKHLLNKRMARIKISGAYGQNQEEEIAEQIRATGAVLFAEADYVVPMSVIPNDPSYSSQWHHGKIGSEMAWNYSTGSSTVQVAMCDSGFDLSHPDLASQFVLPGYNTVKDNSEIDAINGHGTMTSGTLAAIGNNNVGVTGMAWNIRLMPIQITDRADGASTYSDIVECIRYASDHGAKVANISYDYTYTSAAVSDAAAYMRAAGGLVVVAAGNGAADISSWGPSPNLIVVGATDSNDLLTTFSNFGTPVDLVAPGLNIYTTEVGGIYGYVSGTSFSSPIVAGTAALIYSLNPSFTAAQVEQYLLSKTIDLGAQGVDPTFAGGRLSAGSSLQAAAAAADTTVPMINITAPANNATVSGNVAVTVNATDNIGVASVSYYVDTNLIGTVTSAPFSYTLNTTTLANGSHSLSAKAKDFNGNSSTVSTITLNVANVSNNSTPIVLDNLAAGASDAAHTFGGKWCNSPLAGSYMNPSLVSCGNRTDTYRFIPNIAKAQAYKVSIRYLSKSSFSAKVPVKIHSAAGNQTKQINMQTDGGAWTSLGVYNLSAGKNNYVEVSDANGIANVDGVMFEPQ